MRNIEDYSNQYISDDISFEKYQVQYRRRKVMEQIAKYQHDSILEIGCGTEPLFKYFKDYKLMTIVEPSNEFFQIAVDKAEKSSNIRLVNDFFEQAQLSDNQFDLILISSLLHEVPDLENFLKIVKNKCSKETVVHINVPNSNSFHRLLAYKSGIIENPNEFSDTQIKFQVNRVFNLAILKNIVKDIGFEIIDSGSYFIKPFTHLQMKSLIENEIIDEDILDGLYNIIEYMPELGSEIFVDIRLKKQI